MGTGGEDTAWLASAAVAGGAAGPEGARESVEEHTSHRHGRGGPPPPSGLRGTPSPFPRCCHTRWGELGSRAGGKWPRSGGEEGSSEPPPPPGGGSGALLSGHYGGRRSAWDRHGDQNPQKKMKTAFLESAHREAQRSAPLPAPFDGKRRRAPFPHTPRQGSRGLTRPLPLLGLVHPPNTSHARRAVRVCRDADSATSRSQHLMAPWQCHEARLWALALLFPPTRVQRTKKSSKIWSQQECWLDTPPGTQSIRYLNPVPN